MVAAYDLKAFSASSDKNAATFLIFLMFAWSIVPFTYLLGFLFKGYGNAQVGSFFINFLQSIIAIILFILRIIPTT
jgi:ATP-binding cassette subfamily A (ABC1) protein 3